MPTHFRQHWGVVIGFTTSLTQAGFAYRLVTFFFISLFINPSWPIVASESPTVNKVKQTNLAMFCEATRKGHRLWLNVVSDFPVVSKMECAVPPVFTEMDMKLMKPDFHHIHSITQLCIYLVVMLLPSFQIQDAKSHGWRSLLGCHTGMPATGYWMVSSLTNQI
jgi:hypothetical protein